MEFLFLVFFYPTLFGPVKKPLVVFSPMEKLSTFGRLIFSMSLKWISNWRTEQKHFLRGSLHKDSVITLSFNDHRVFS